MKTSQEIVNASGYPLQLRIEKEIENTEDNHYWRVLIKEHRWVNDETKDEGFIDLVLANTVAPIRLVIECKRIIGSWTFLLPSINPDKKHPARIHYARYDDFKFVWDEYPIIPESYSSAFCVMETDGKRDNRTLEKLSGELLLSLEYLAAEEMHLKAKANSKPFNGGIFYIPVIVTTAKLQKCAFDPMTVDIANGEIPDSSIDEIGFIRFRKNLATSLEYDAPDITNLRKSNEENDRTVFVVQAKEFTNFLTKITIG